MAKVYNTAGKRRLVELLENNSESQFSVDEICIALNGNLSKRSSVYRNLADLCAQGRVGKFHSESGYVYQYTGGRDCSKHFHLKCTKCERIVHLECDMGEELTAHLMSHHGFFVDSGKSVLYGVCGACAEK